MKVNTFVSTVSLALILFIVGFAGRSIVFSNSVEHVITRPAFNNASAVPAVRGVIYDGGFPAYAAVVNVAALQVRSAPDDAAPVIDTYGKTNDEGAPQTFLVKGQQMANAQADWYQVLLPVRPNETKGWVHASDVDIEGMAWRVDVHLKSFKLDVYKDDALQAGYAIGTGTDKTPTPSGEYSISELLKPPSANTIYGTHVLGLNGYSNVETDWPGGGHIAIHGTNDPKATIGHQVSHGCVRLTDANIDTLASELPLGTPVEISSD